MIVIVASRWDAAAAAYASRCAAHDVRILTARDLSLAGWRQYLHWAEGETAMIDGQVVPQQQITGVLTLVRGVSVEEPVEIVPRDRAYVAAEMTAFLLFWLSRLTCPILNRPTPACLSGPDWRPEKWVRTAFQAGIPAVPVHRLAAFGNLRAPEEAAAGVVDVTVVGPRTFGEVDPCLHRCARQLAAMAGVELAQFRFSSPQGGGRFMGASTFPGLTEDWLADAALEYLRGGVAAPA